MYNYITGSGSYIPKIKKTNADFSAADFYDENKSPLPYGMMLLLTNSKR